MRGEGQQRRVRGREQRRGTAEVKLTRSEDQQRSRGTAEARGRWHSTNRVRRGEGQKRRGEGKQSRGNKQRMT
jgi:hypothetical protein